MYRYVYIDMYVDICAKQGAKHVRSYKHIDIIVIHILSSTFFSASLPQECQRVHATREAAQTGLMETHVQV